MYTQAAHKMLTQQHMQALTSKYKTSMAGVAVAAACSGPPTWHAVFSLIIAIVHFVFSCKVLMLYGQASNWSVWLEAFILVTRSGAHTRPSHAAPANLCQQPQSTTCALSMGGTVAHACCAPEQCVAAFACRTGQSAGSPELAAHWHVQGLPPSLHTNLRGEVDARAHVAQGRIDGFPGVVGAQPVDGLLHLHLLRMHGGVRLCCALHACACQPSQRPARPVVVATALLIYPAC